MKIQEYQAKSLFTEFGIPTTKGLVADTPAGAASAAQTLGLPVVLKAQVHVGGRGKAGGVKLVSKMEDVAPTAETILGLTIKEFMVKKILVAPAAEIRKEVYLSLLIDRAVSKVVFIGCADGGVEIEETAKTSPEKILRLEIQAGKLASLTREDCLPLASKLFIIQRNAEEAADIMVLMGKMFVEKDCSLIEINPLVVDGEGKVLALDAKVLLDDNALFRHPESVDFARADMNGYDPDSSGLSFVELDGQIGCMVNGAGLAMATMDIIKHYGGSPANFLDVGGSSDPQKVVNGFKLILADKNVKAILLNIFGGITRCDDIVNGILEARKLFEVKVPIVVRLAGTNEAEGRLLLKETDMIAAESLEQGAKKAIEIGRN